MAMTFVETRLGSVKKVKCTWTSNATGDASGSTTHGYSGQFLGLITVPGTAGNQPSDNYDLTVTDSDGVDLLMGGGLNRSNATTQFIKQADMAGVASDKLTFTIAGAGDTKKGAVYLLLR